MKKNNKYFIYFFGMLLLATAVQAIGSSPSPTSDMILFYRFANNSTVGDNTTQAYDYSGNNNNGSILSAVYNSTGGILGRGSFIFNGSGNITTPDSNTLDINRTSFTLNAWIYPTNASEAYIIFKGTDTTNFNYYLRRNFDSGIRCAYGNSTTGSGILTAGNATLNTWTLVTCVFDRSQMRLFTYINGALSSNSAVLTVEPEPGSTVLQLGARYTNQKFSGELSETIIFNRALSAGEVSALYNIYLSGVCGTVPTENCTVSASTNFTAGTYNISNSITVYGQGTVLDCKQAKIQGTYAASGYTVVSKDVTIKNCVVDNYSSGITLNEYRSSIFNNTIIDSLLGVYANRTGNHTISNNTIYYRTSQDVGAYAIDLTRTNYTTVFNNTVHNATFGVYLTGFSSIGSWNNTIDSNSINWVYGAISGLQNGIVVYENGGNNIIKNNRVFSPGHNGINIRSFNNSVFNNTINYAYHHGIDLFSCQDETWPVSGNNVYSNTINNMREETFFYFCNATNNRVFNNTLTNMSGTGVDNKAFVFNLNASNNYVYNNDVYDYNTGTNAWGQSAQGSYNNTVYNNRFTGNAEKAVRMHIDTTSSANYTNNTLNTTIKFLDFTYSAFYGYYNITAPSTTQHLFYNLNSAQANITVNNLNNSVIYHSNGTYQCTGNCNGTQNVTVNANAYVIIIQNYAGQISFLDLYPVSATPSLFADQVQLFSFSLVNPSSAGYSATWYVDGVNQTSSYNNSNISITGSNAGTYNITLFITSSSNNLTNTWTLTVSGATEDEIEACSGIANSVNSALVLLSLFFGILALTVIVNYVVAIKTGEPPKIDLMNFLQENTLIVVVSCLILVLTVIIVSAMIGVC